MVKQVTLKNLVNNRVIELTLNGDTAYVIDEIDWGAPSGTLQSYQLYGQIGQTVVGTSVSTRAVTIIGYVYAKEEKPYYGDLWEEYYESLLELLEEKKNELNRLINLFQDVQITVGDYHVTGRPTSAVKYSSSYRENNEVLCRFQIEITCGDPMFTKQERIETIFEGASVVIENEGDVEVGGTITVTASGLVENPKITNTKTNDFVEIRTLLKIGDIMTIETKDNQENVLIYREEEKQTENGLTYMLEGSTFLKFTQGGDTYAYSAESGQENMGVKVTIQEQYFNLQNE